MRRQKRFSICNLRIAIALVLVAGAALFAACQPEVNKQPAAPAPSPSASPSSSPSASPSASPSGSPANKLESWAGKWQGVEGTYLTITKKAEAVDKTKPASTGEEKFTIVIANLDKPSTYEGVAKGDHIEFVRNGKTEMIKAATGAETGMKGFENEKNCLVVTKGSEGFCRK